jgi:hypothetical protein
MNQILQTFTIWSFRNELRYVILAFLVVLSLPFIAVVILTHTGISIVSDALIDVSAVTRNILILNPADGSVVTELHKPIAWPVTGVITLRFGESSRYQLFHTGLDIANSHGYVGDRLHHLWMGK